jgi:hypothetical protein
MGVRRQGGGEIEDWELWGDPREIERRKAERARGAVPPDIRAQQARHACFILAPCLQLSAQLHHLLWAAQSNSAAAPSS